ncbi:FAD-binding oxidoreductase [Microcella frigidaquae]|uniref:FAD/FMN-containing dehydrogenase n=1 Tax=Microcella frigidaquae TaxID=424758 RepID=A0A840X5T9_9MICO|nr:FAD-binding oxidoreductase [Microcella frigidaquae]MBB5616584.1 FAD/FMN-containing dehydrogenase [Microcella frigidaquae]NHN43974.1 FAD-binding oxidoreductase [Microcella frigidaquae]
MPSSTALAPVADRVAALTERLPFLRTPADPRYDALRQPWHCAHDQHPAAIAEPASAEDVRLLVDAARQLGMRLAPQGTGHGALPLAQHRLDDVVLVRTGGLDAVIVDPSAHRVRVGSGVRWGAVVAATAPHGLAALHGSSPTVGVAGYCLGGGIGWYARALGTAANSVTALEVVTADGQLRRVDHDHDPELFWALRGGGGGLGIVTALELRLEPIADVVAGMLWWPIERTEEVLRTWLAVTRDAPDALTTSFRVMRFPALPELPDAVRGRQLVVIDGAALTDDTTAEALLAPLRALAPELDTWRRVPAATLPELHMDPIDPTPAAGHSTLLGQLDDAAVAALVAAVGPDADSALLFAELRQLGGALSRAADGAGVLARLDGDYALLLLGIAPDEAAVRRVRDEAERIIGSMTPWATGGEYLNFAEGPVETRRAYPAEAWDRLLRIRSAHDPQRMFVANHDFR